MKVKIVKSLLSIYGAMVPGMEINVPDHIGRSWVNNKIAVALDGPAVIPAGKFWCAEHQTLHKLTSRQGKKCLKRIEAEAAAATAAAESAAKAEAKTMEPEATEPQLTEQANDLNAEGGEGPPLVAIDPLLR